MAQTKGTKQTSKVGGSSVKQTAKASNTGKKNSASKSTTSKKTASNIAKKSSEVKNAAKRDTKRDQYNNKKYANERVNQSRYEENDLPQGRNAKLYDGEVNKHDSQYKAKTGYTDWESTKYGRKHANRNKPIGYGYSSTNDKSGSTKL